MEDLDCEVENRPGVESTANFENYPGVDMRANFKSISHICHLFEVAFVW